VSYGDYTGHPLFPGFVYAMRSAETSLRAILEQDHVLGRVKQATGYQSESARFAQQKASRIDLDELSKNLADASNSIDLVWVVIDTAKQVLDLVTDGSSRFREAQATSWDALSEVARYMLKHISSQKQYNGQRLKRVENQMTIVSRP
jgi:hypothetical protein